MLIIPDVHENISAVRAILEAHPNEPAIFLGDWFDKFPSQPGSFDSTLKWLAKNAAKRQFTFLFGNHDLPYIWPYEDLMCSGWERQKAFEIIPLIPLIERNFRFYTEYAGWVISHAGFSKEWPPPTFPEGDPRLEDHIRAALKEGYVPHILRAGRSRGGSSSHGGITWQDWHEFVPLKSTRQIVGHSRGKAPRTKGTNWCLDTGLQNYGRISPEGLTILKTSKL